MTLPQVTAECLTAVLEKSTQQSPDEFAAEVMTDLIENQPVLMEGITSILVPFLEACNINEHQGRELNSETRHELMLMAQFCVMGVTLKAIAAQAEAKEMEEAWE
jgi:hypothetical protein|tara:strand:- start:1969 stop:2283 length:315 start_codon:yes stop_codon:yes gene_type:complete